MYSDFANQRNTYKLVENLIGNEAKNAVSLLSGLVKDIVDEENFEIVGGRVWEIVPEKKVYTLKFQYGKLNKIPDDYHINLNDQPILEKLTKQRVVLNKETDLILQEKGIELFSIIGVGDIVTINKKRYYTYVLGFNAKQILQSFYETLSIISSVASTALRNLKMLAESEKIRKDLVSASEIQRNLLPDHHIRFNDCDVFGVCLPDNEVGGDYFDYIKNSDTEDERLGIVISDAASKGLPAAIQSLFVSGAIRMGMSYAVRISDLFGRMNSLIYDTFIYEHFVTLFYCELTLSENRLVLYANAGHCAPIHYRPVIDQFKFLGPTGGLLGILPSQKFGVENLRMHPGDILVLYTDGLTEAMSEDKELFGEKRLCDLIRKHKDLTPKELCYLIIEEVQKFTAKSPYTDDRTIVIIKRDKSSGK